MVGPMPVLKPASDAVETALGVVLRTEPTLKAWAYLDPERARREAATSEVRGLGVLSGVVVGVKDLFDTADQPTQYGSPIYEGYRPVADAAAVALLREAGAVCLGKTVTAELGCTHPGPTTNPHRATHTPGGSSMGSAAAVAAGTVDLALGTQTAGSIIRPASFCGIYGFKPTFGSVSTAGVKCVAPSLDTVGWFARDPELLDEVRAQLTGRPEATPLRQSPTIGLLRTEQWAECAEQTRQALVAVADIAQALGAEVVNVEMPPPMVGLAAKHQAVLAYEAARALAWEHRVRRDRLSTALRELLDYGRTVGPAELDAIQAQKAAALAAAADLFTRCAAVLTPCVEGEAPRGLSSTGDPRFCALWSLLGLPAVSVPAATGPTGLPIGVQLVGGAGDDARLLAVIAWLTGGKVVPPTGPVPVQGLLV
jgi:Asp-tRNA(Asn)/Glu-tRNA(Gln) amidotransferase A subunit family amidase